MWKYVYDSIIGTSHTESGQPCQDYSKGIVHKADLSEVLIATCLDGAGSARLSQLGAQVAGDRFLAEAQSWLDLNGHSAAPDEATVKSWVCSARASLLEKATEAEALPRDLACTMLGAVVGETWAVFIQIGDGAIVFDAEGVYQIAFWPDNGEYANTTYFLSDDQFKSHLRIEILKQPIAEFAVFTDGLQMIALDFVNNQPHARFFKPLFATVRASQDQERLQQDLVAYLSSDRMNQRTDDDKSLLLATRIIEQLNNQPNSSTDDV